MPGVPSGRGCDACRRQRKKCDQLKPTCSRCSRLELDCIGAGTQRYIFKDDSRSGSPHSQSPLSPASDALSARSTPSSSFSHLSQSPTNLLADELVSKIKDLDDLRYHLLWNYGAFIADIPCRLGTNAALDTAIALMLSAHTDFASHRQGSKRVVSTSCLNKYSKALRTLHAHLDDPSLARTTETLCAVMLLLVCQGFLGISPTSCSTNHGEGAGHILRARGFRYDDSADEFEGKLLLSLRGPVLFEALVNPRICFSAEEWILLTEHGFEGEGPESVALRALAKVPDILERGKRVLASRGGGEAGSELAKLIEETKAGHEIVKATSTVSLQRYVALPAENSGLMTAYRWNILYAHFQRTHGLCVAITLIFNGLLSALSRHSNLSSPILTELEAEATQLSEAILELADQAMRYRPLGASFVTLCAITAWCLCKRDTNMRERLVAVLLDYMGDFAEPKVEELIKELGVIEMRLGMAV